MRSTHLCASLRGVEWDERREVFYPGSAPHGGGKSLHPALLILMMMITITRVLYLESYRLVCLTLTCPTRETCPSWGAVSLLIKVGGAGYMWSPSRTRITILQVES